MQANIDRQFPSAFQTQCRKVILEQVMGDYANAAGTQRDQLSVVLQEHIRANAEPLLESCACVRGRLKPHVESVSSAEAQITLDIGSLMRGECKPTDASVSTVRQGFMRLLRKMPAPRIMTKSKRAAFTLQTTSQMQPSLYASYERPPESLSRLVLLLPATGSACHAQMICMEEGALKIVTLTDPRIQGLLSREALDAVIAQYGEDVQVIASGHNYTNFKLSDTVGQAVYPVSFIDGLPIESTRTKRIWFVMFNEFEGEVGSTWRDFKPALASVILVELDDAP